MWLSFVLLLSAVSAEVRYSVKWTKNSIERADLWAEKTLLRQSGQLPSRRFPKFNQLVQGFGVQGTPIEPMENYYDEAWVGNVSVGTPLQGPFSVILDTGSSNFWIPSVTCTTKGCVNKTKYDHTKSSTYKATQQQFFIPYGTGHVSGNIVNDTVVLAGASVVSDQLGEATGMAEFFEEYPIDGILGLAFAVISIPPNISTVFDQMWDQKLIDQNLFSVYLSTHEASDESVIIFGGFDKQYILPGETFTYAPVNEPSYWLIFMDNVKAANKIVYPCPYSGGCPVVVDTGTSIIAGPNGEIEPLLEAIGTVNADCSNVNSLPNISFSISGKDFVVPPQIYVIYEMTSNGTTCLLGLEGINPLEVGPLWILGDPFLRAYYTVFDRTTKPPRVGFAPAIPTQPKQ